MVIRIDEERQRRTVTTRLPVPAAVTDGSSASRDSEQPGPVGLAEPPQVLEDQATGYVLKIPCSFRVTLPTGRLAGPRERLGDCRCRARAQG